MLLLDTSIVARWVYQMKVNSLPICDTLTSISPCLWLPYLCYGFRSHVNLEEAMQVPPGNVREFIFHSTNLWPIWNGTREFFFPFCSPENLLFIWTLRRLSISPLVSECCNLISTPLFWLSPLLPTPPRLPRTSVTWGCSPYKQSSQSFCLQLCLLRNKEQDRVVGQWANGSGSNLGY